MKVQMDESSDEILVEEARRGNRAAFGELARRHRGRIYGLVFGMTRSHPDADDLCQEVFLTAYRSLGAFNRKSSFTTWIYRIAVNKSLNLLKRRKREGGRTEFRENLLPSDRACPENPEILSFSRELQGHLKAAVDSLPGSFRATFIMVATQGMSHSAAARVLGCSENTISWRMHKARKLLRARMNPFLTERTE